MKNANPNIAIRITSAEQKAYAIIAITRALEMPLSQIANDDDLVWNGIFNDKRETVEWNHIVVREEKIRCLYKSGGTRFDRVYEFSEISQFLKDLVVTNIRVNLSSGRVAEVSAEGIKIQEAAPMGYLLSKNDLALLSEAAAKFKQ